MPPTAPVLKQNPAASPPCAQPTGAVKEGAVDFLCQRGEGHPGVHEVMLEHGSRMAWGSSADMDADHRANGFAFDTDELGDEDDD